MFLSLAGLFIFLPTLPPPPRSEPPGVVYDQMEYSFDANKRGQLSKGEFQGWTGFLDVLCTHPLFLAVMQDEYENGFPSKEYCVFLRQRILAQPQGHEILTGVYSNVLDSTWVNSVGSKIKR